MVLVFPETLKFTQKEIGFPHTLVKKHCCKGILHPWFACQKPWSTFVKASYTHDLLALSCFSRSVFVFFFFQAMISTSLKVWKASEIWSNLFWMLTKWKQFHPSPLPTFTTWLNFTSKKTGLSAWQDSILFQNLNGFTWAVIKFRQVISQ